MCQSVKLFILKRSPVTMSLTSSRCCYMCVNQSNELFLRETLSLWVWPQDVVAAEVQVLLLSQSVKSVILWKILLNENGEKSVENEKFSDVGIWKIIFVLEKFIFKKDCGKNWQKQCAFAVDLAILDFCFVKINLYCERRCDIFGNYWKSSKEIKIL